MKTLFDIRESILKTISAYEAKKEELAQQLIILEAASDADALSISTAAEAGDQAAYSEATTAKAFHDAQLAHARKASVAPLFTQEELAALVQEIQTQCDAECYPVYEDMLRLRELGAQTIDQLDRIHQECNVIESILRHAMNARVNVFPLHSVHGAFKEMFCPGPNDYMLHKAHERAKVASDKRKQE